MVAHVEKRDGKWVARYTDPDGHRRGKRFGRKLDADRFLATTTVALLVGEWVDPVAGRVTVGSYARQWVDERDVRDSTRASYVRYLKHITALPAQPLGRMALGDLKQAHLRAWQRHLRAAMADSTAATIRGVFAAILKSAVADRLIPSSPMVGVKAPKVIKRKVRPMAREHVRDMLTLITPHYQAAVMVGAGCGLRRGEAFGLTVDHVDFLRGVIHVDRQLIGATRDHRPVFGPPKTPASVRDVPMPRAVVDALAAHLARYGPGVDGLIFRSARQCPATRTKVGEAWRDAEVRRWARETGRPLLRDGRVPKAVAEAFSLAYPDGRGTRFHDLRHFYVSELIADGASVKVVQARVGHATAAETLDTYAHFWPDVDDEKTRATLDAVFTTMMDGTVRDEVNS